jgi:PTH1 family peptidyl-tRNA hydrolase
LAFRRLAREGDALGVTGVVAGHKVRLLKPQTYYQPERGTCCAPSLARPFWAPQTDLLVVCDDVRCRSARFRIRPQGSAGGSNGLKSIEHTLRHQQYPRVRVGTHPRDDRGIGDLVDFVLSPFDAVERQEVLDLFPRVVDACEVWLRDGVVAAMNKHNGQAQAKP